MSVEIGLVNPRLTILDRFAVAAGDVYRKSARRDMLPIIRGLMGQYGYTDAEPQVLETKVRGISPGYVAIGYQPDPSNPVRVVLDPAGHVRPTVGVATADGAPLKFLPGPANTTPENGAMEWAAAGSAPTFVYGGTRKTFAFAGDVIGLPSYGGASEGDTLQILAGAPGWAAPTGGGGGDFVTLVPALLAFDVGAAGVEAIYAKNTLTVGDSLQAPGDAAIATVTPGEIKTQNVTAGGFNGVFAKMVTTDSSATLSLGRSLLPSFLAEITQNTTDSILSLTDYTNSFNVTVKASDSEPASGFFFGGIRVVGGQQAFIADPTGGATEDAEARSAVVSILSAMKAHGLIASV